MAQWITSIIYYRLIESFLPVGIHNDHSSRAKGVLGICEANYLQPTHNKQVWFARP